MSSATVLRVEDRAGHGPYYNYDYQYTWGRTDEDDDEQSHWITPGADPGLSERWGELGDAYHFGFADEAQFRRWFSKEKWLTALAKAGFKLAVYEVPEDYIVKGTAQVCFNIRQAERVLAIDLAEII